MNVETEFVGEGRMKVERSHRVLIGAVSTLFAAQLALAGGDAAATRAAVNPMHALDKGMFKGFVDKPLFDPARSLPPPPPPVAMVAAPPPAPEQPPPNVRLLGIIQGDLDLAIVRRDGDTKTEILSSGDRIDDWEVTVLPTGTLRLHKGERTNDYALFENKAGAGVTPSTAEIEAAPHLTPDDPAAARNARLQARTN